MVRVILFRKFIHLFALFVRGVLLTKGSDSSFAEAHSALLSEPTHMEGEDEDQKDEVEDERDCEECKVESRREVRTNTAHGTWMT